MKKRINLTKIWFYAASIFLLIGLSFAIGLYSGAKRNRLYMVVESVADNIERTITEVLPDYLSRTKSRPAYFLQEARYKGDGVTINNTSADQNDLILLCGFFEGGNQLRLVRRDGEIIQRWPVSFFEIFKDRSYLYDPPRTDWHVDTDGALALPDGSVVFNFEYRGTVKLDRCGNVMWKIEHPTHHSLERSEKGGYWVAGQRLRQSSQQNLFPPFKLPYLEDTILKISESGEIKREISVPKLIYDNGQQALLTATGDDINPRMFHHWDGELVHLNKIEELPSSLAPDFPQFEAGDLALSMRNYNLVMIIDPESEKIKWFRTGPWIRQHDPEFKAGGIIAVFNNNAYNKNFLTLDSGLPSDFAHMSNIIEFSPATEKSWVAYGSRKGQEMLTIERGKIEVTPNGGYLVTEFEGGRVFEIDASGRIIWEYINRFDSDTVAEITDARLYSQDYFSVADWKTCN